MVVSGIGQPRTAAVRELTLAYLASLVVVLGIGIRGGVDIGR